VSTPGITWTRDEIDRGIARLETERDAISAGLMALDDHPGRRLLEGAALEGRTKERWETCRTDIARLWDLYTVYSTVLNELRAIRARRSRPTRAELDEMGGLLTGPSVEVPGRDVPIAQRGLVDPVASARRVTLDVLVAEMNQVWQRVTEMVAAVDEVWSAVLPRLDRVEAAAAETSALIDRLGGAQALSVEASVVAEVRTRLGDARGQVAADPLRFAGNTATSKRIGAVDLDRLDSDLKSVHDALRQLRLLQERYEERAQRFAGLVDVLAADEAEGQRRRAHVVSRITHGVPDVPAQAETLRTRVAQVRDLRRKDAWPQLSAQLSALERDAAAATERLRAAWTDLDALLARRDELRGLLQAYRAMAGGRGRGEDEALEAIHHRAYEVLWRAPCDLDDAARLVGEYQHAVTAPRSGDHRAVRRPAPGIQNEDGAERPRGEGKNHDHL
jgi:hypothetical protein